LSEKGGFASLFFCQSLAYTSRPPELNHKKRRIIMFRLYTWTLALIFSVSVQANQLPDPLDLPAQKTARAVSSLMTDITTAGDRLIVVGGEGAVLYSDDSGASWQQADVPVRVALTSVQFVNDQLGWAVGHDGLILNTTDAGESWAVQLTGRATGEKLLATATAWQASVEEQMGGELSPEEEEALYLQMDAAAMAVDEAQREIEIGPNRPFMDVYFRNENEGYAVGAFGYFFSTQDGGATWEDSSSLLPNYELLNLYGITELSGGEMVIVGEFGLVLHSADGGKTWVQQDVGYQGSLFGVYPGALDGVGLIVGLRGNAFLSHDGGVSWRNIKAGRTSILDVATIPDDKAVFVGLAGAVTVVDMFSHVSKRVPVKSRSHFASVAVTKDGNLVLVGDSGIIRIKESGEVLPVEIKMEAAQ
jgi:photosystem II stability/assembly factor-like uncharacterized protein